MTPEQMLAGLQEQVKGLAETVQTGSITTWMIRHAAFLQTRFSVGKGGKNTIQETTSQRLHEPASAIWISSCLCVFLSTRWHARRLCTIDWRTIVEVSLGGVRAFVDGPFSASDSPGSTFFVVQKVRVWLHD